jgi:beta-glucosidase
MWVLPSVKHFAGDGGTVWGTTKPQSWLPGSNWQAATGPYKIDQGDTQLDEETFRSLHLAPYVAAIKAGALNVMVSFSSWNGDKMHGNKYLLTDVLKGEFGFEGFIVTDWGAIDQLEESFHNCVVRSINAGVDMVMVPFDYKRFIETLIEAVNNGDVAQDRIDDAVRRILLVKFKLGLFEKPLPDESWLKYVGSKEHRAIACEAVQKSLVLLKNEKQTLPLDKGLAVLVAGQAADDIGLACGGWSIEWQGGNGAITTGKTLLHGIREITDGLIDYQKDADFNRKVPLGIVVIAEPPYAEGMGDTADLSLSAAQKTIIQKTREQCEKLLLIIYSGRPLIITDVAEYCDAIVAAWLPGTEVHAIAEVLYGDAPFTGKLAFSWPRTMQQIPLSALQASKEQPFREFDFGLTAD